MAGLLNLTDDPQTLGLLSLGLRLMSTPGKFGTALGQSGLGAMDDVLRQTQWLKEQKRRDEDTRMRTELFNAQQEDARRQRERQAAVDEAFRGAVRTPAQQALAAGGGPTVGNAQAMRGLSPTVDQAALIQNLLGADPVAAAKLAMPQKRDVREVGGSLVEVPQSGPVTPLYTSPQKEAAPTDLSKLIAERDKLPPGHPALPMYDAAIAKMTTHAPGVSVSYGAPVAGLDPQGNPVFFQPGKGGGAPSIVQGVTPPEVADKQRARQQEQERAASVAQRAHSTITQMLGHPGLDTVLGLSGKVDPRNYVWGTEAQGAKALVEQAQGQAFLQAFETLKGGGQITQIEGEKATAAIARLSRAQSEKDFKAAAKELSEIAEAAYERATSKKLPKKKRVVRTGTLNGRKVVQYEDGSTDYAD